MKNFRLFGLIALSLILCFALVACQETTLTSITLNTDNVQKTFTVGDEFNYDGLVVTANYSDDSSEPVTDYSVSTPDMSTDGSKTVTVTYKGMVADYQITVSESSDGKPDDGTDNKPDVPRTLQSISLNVSNVKRSFEVGETFTYEGLVVTANYNVAPLTETVTDYTVNEDEIDTSVAGQKTVIVSYKGFTASYEIVVNAKVAQLDRIEVDASGVKTEYKVGEAFSVSGIVVTAYYDDGTSARVTDFTVPEKPDMTTAGTKTVTVEYQGKTATYDIMVNDLVVKGISVNTDNVMKVFAVGDEFNYEGLVVRAGYEGSSTFNVVTDYTVTAPDMTTPGTKTVTVEYKGISKTYEIEVTDAELQKIEVDTSNAKTEYYVGGAFSADGIVVTATYADGKTTLVKGYSVSQPDMTTTGDKTITIEYNSKTATYTITVQELDVTVFDDEYNGEELILQAELSDREGMSNVQNGATGQFVGNIANGDKITFAFKSTVEGPVDIYLSISHGNNGITRAFDVYVNGEMVGQFDAQNSGSWQSYKEFIVCTVELKVGLNVVEFDAINSGALVNIDYMKVVPEGYVSDNSTYAGKTLVVGASSNTALQGRCNVQNGYGPDGTFIGDIDSSGVISFTVNSKVAAAVNLSVFVAGVDEFSYEVVVNGKSVGTFTAQTWEWVNFMQFNAGSAMLNEGQNTIEIHFLSGACNFTHLQISPAE